MALAQQSGEGQQPLGVGPLGDRQRQPGQRQQSRAGSGQGVLGLGQALGAGGDLGLPAIRPLGLGQQAEFGGQGACRVGVEAQPARQVEQPGVVGVAVLGASRGVVGVWSRTTWPIA
jgi:hypothetical protein